MKSLTGMFPSTRGWALLLILLLGAGFLVAGCGEEEVPAPTTPAPPPPPPAPEPEPEPEPEPPATPTGLMVSGSTTSSITWTWNAVEGAIGYVVQANMDEMWDDTDTVMFNGVPFTTMTTYTASDLEAGTTVYVRVAAAAGTAAAPLVSDFSTHVTGMAMAAALSAPANLEVKERGSDFIEWEWDAVDGADGYQSEFSIDAAFSAPDAAFHAADQRTRRASNLDPNSDGYLRVRALVGTLSEATFGTWSAASMGSTGAPPPPSAELALDVPENVRTSNASETAITVQWDAVEDADNYFVQQSEAGDDWVAASCGVNGDSEVSVTVCVASGLSRATDYRFRVRATQEDGDRSDSDWSAPTATLRTSGIAPPPPITGDENDLNVQWRSGATAITWNWDPVTDRANRQRIDHLVVAANGSRCPENVVYAAAASPISTALTAVTLPSTAAWTNLGANISASTTVTEGAVATLCLVRTWLDEMEGGVNVRRFGTLQVVPATTMPVVGTPTTSAPNTARKTAKITWPFTTDKGFEYEASVLSASIDDDLPSDCDQSTGLQKFTTTADNVMQSYSVTPKEYQQYNACVRATSSDDSGYSEWAMFSDVQRSLPGQPSAPSYRQAESDTPADSHGSQLANKLVWSVAEKATTPRDSGDYRVAVYYSTASTRAPTNDLCGGNAGSDYTSVTATPSLAAGGITITAGDGTTDLLSAVNAVGTYRFYACVQADPTPTNAGGADNDHGPWNISGATSVQIKAPGVPRGLKSTSDGTSITWTWDSVQSRSTETITYDVRFGPTCPPTTDGWSPGADEGEQSGIGADARTRSVTGLAASTTRHLRVRATRTRGGSSGWSSCVSGRTTN